MLEALQGFTAPGAGTGTSSVLGGILLSWLIWPIVCGFLGARRGQPFKAAMNGFMWGPFGLVFVLLAKERHCCPTCGKRTLDRRYEPEMATPAIPEAMAAMTAPPKLALPKPCPALIPIPSARKEEALDLEEQQLLAWVNGGQPTTQ